jgi:hypothetical protein
MELPPNDDLNPYASPKAEAPAGDGQGPDQPKTLGAGEVIRIEGVLSPKDLYHANRLLNKPTPQTSIGCVVVILLVASFFWFLVFNVEHKVTTAWALLALLLLVPAVAIGYVGLRQARRIRRYCDRQRGMCAGQRIEISDSELKQQSDTASALYQWTAFSTCTSSKRVVLLHFDPPAAMFYEPPFGFLIIPRAFFTSDAEWDCFLRLVREKLPKRYRETKSDD